MLFINTRHFNASQALLCSLTLLPLCFLTVQSYSMEALHVLFVLTLMLLLLIKTLLCFLTPAQQALTCNDGVQSAAGRW